MARTQAERDANDMIEAAIEAYREAYLDAHPEAVRGILQDWIVVAAENKPDADEACDALLIIMPGGGIPTYRAIGLLEMGRRYVMESSEEEDV